MRRISFFTIAFLTILATLPAFDSDPEFGIDRGNLSLSPAPERASTLEAIRALGADWFSDGYNTKVQFEDFVDEVRLAKQQSLKFMMKISPNHLDYDEGVVAGDNGGDAFKRRCGWSSGSPKYSRVNSAKLAARLGTQLDALKAAGLTVDAFQIGSEVDWICFNGDVPDGHEATQDEFMTAVRGYAHFLKTAAEVIHAHYPNAKILTFGIAHVSDIDSPPHHFSRPARMIAALRNLDGFNYLDNASYHVDAYGEHIYPKPNYVAKDTLNKMREDIEILGHDRPYWVTEWGLNSKSFPDKEGETRVQAAAQFYKALDSLHVSFGPLFYFGYDWAGGKGLTDQSGNPQPDAKAILLHK